MQIKREWATPLTMGAFLLSGLTGILMFFHLDSGLNKPAHEWLGWAMIGGVLLHASVNWASFKRYFGQKSGRVILAGFTVITAASFIPLGQEGGPNSQRKIGEAVMNAPLSTVAQLARKQPETLLADLQAAGIPISGTQQNLASVLAGDRQRQRAALGVIFN